MSFLLVLLTLTASLSPLNTFAHLWQVKEWRLDRLREHLRSEGVALQLFGIARPVLLVLALPALLLRVIPVGTWTAGVLTLFTAVTVAKFALDRQSTPVWTAKVIAVVCGAVLFSLILIFAILALLPDRAVPALALVVLLTPITVTLSWTMLLPLDLFLKHRVMELARSLRERHPEVIVVGITGSVGKTTTKELLLHLLLDRGAHATPAYMNAEVGVARWLTAELSGSILPRILIVEMGAYRAGEIALLCSVARPLIGIITFIGTQHIALFQSQEKLLTAKAELFDALPRDGAAILNGDSPFASVLHEHAHCRSIVVSTGGSADMEATDIEETSSGLRLRVGSTMVTTPLRGTHNVTNILLAMAAAEILGLPRPEIARKLISFRPPEHTFAVRTVGTVTLLDDTHNASPASFKAALGWAKSQPAGQKVLLTSGLIELGEEEDRVHAELGVEAAGVFDRVIFTHHRHARAFERGFGRPVEFLGKRTEPVLPAALFACIGRIQEPLIHRLLPKS